MVVGIDIDDTMTNHCSAWFQVYNEYFKKENVEDLKLEDAYKWSFYDDWDKEERDHLMMALTSRTSDYYKHLEILPDVNDVISKIINSDNTVVIISATSKDMQEEKKKWLLERIPSINEDDIIFTTNKHLINVDVMIDDNLESAKFFPCPYLLYRRPWNTNRPSYEYSDNIVNVGSWKDIERVLKGMNIINSEIDNTETIFSKATSELIEGLKRAKSDKEYIEILNPYIKLWQQQGMLIGMRQINDATISVIGDVIKNMKEDNKT